MKAKKVAITSTLVRELSSFVYADSPRLAQRSVPDPLL